MTHRGLYQQLADAVRVHSGSEELVDTVYALACDEVESAVAQCRDDLLYQSGASANTLDHAVDDDRLGHTEAEAAQRWCPFVREATPVGKGKKDTAIGNRYLTAKEDFTNPAGCRCVASHCMAWRFTGPDRGYCGLAGPVVRMPANEPRHLRNRVPPPRQTTPDLFDDLADGCRDVVSSTT